MKKSNISKKRVNGFVVPKKSAYTTNRGYIDAVRRLNNPDMTYKEFKSAYGDGLISKVGNMKGTPTTKIGLTNLKAPSGKHAENMQLGTYAREVYKKNPEKINKALEQYHYGKSFGDSYNPEALKLFQEDMKDRKYYMQRKKNDRNVSNREVLSALEKSDLFKTGSQRVREGALEKAGDEVQKQLLELTGYKGIRSLMKAQEDNKWTYERTGKGNYHYGIEFRGKDGQLYMLEFDNSPTKAKIRRL